MEHQSKDKRTPGLFYAEDLLTQVGGNVFRLVRLAVKRALELDAGKPSLITNLSTDKVTTIALEEIYQGKVKPKASTDKETKK